MTKCDIKKNYKAKQCIKKRKNCDLMSRLRCKAQSCDYLILCIKSLRVSSHYYHIDLVDFYLKFCKYLDTRFRHTLTFLTVRHTYTNCHIDIQHVFVKICNGLICLSLKLMLYIFTTRHMRASEILILSLIMYYC